MDVVNVSADELLCVAPVVVPATGYVLLRVVDPDVVAVIVTPLVTVVEL